MRLFLNSVGVKSRTYATWWTEAEIRVHKSCLQDGRVLLADLRWQQPVSHVIYANKSRQRWKSHCIGLINANELWSRLEGTCKDGKNGYCCRDEGVESLHDEQVVCYEGTDWILKIQSALSMDSSSSFYRHLPSLRLFILSLRQACPVYKRIFSPHSPPPASLLAPDAEPTVARFSRGLNYEGNTTKLIGGKGQNRPGAAAWWCNAV